MTLVKYILLGLALWLATAVSAQDQHNLPLLGDSTSGVISLEAEYNLGRAVLRAVRQQSDLMQDPLLQDYLENHIYRLAAHSQLQDHRLDIVIIDQSALNAFAVPGGVIGINAGLFTHAENVHQFASVVAHELSHLSQRHFARNVEASQRYQPISIAMLLASLLLAASSNGEAAIASLATTQAASIQQQLSYSRSIEREADRLALDTMYAAGLDPRQMPKMFERMHRNLRYSGGLPPEFLLTHPLTEARVADTANRAEQYPKGKYSRDIDYQLMRQRVFLHFSERDQMAEEILKQNLRDSRNPQALAYHYGLALLYLRQQQADTAKLHIQILKQALPNHLFIQLLEARWLASAGQYPKALDQAEQLFNNNPNNYPITLFYAELLAQQQRYRQAETVLARQTLERPRDPLIWQRLAEIRGTLEDAIGSWSAQAEYLFLIGEERNAFVQLEQAIKAAQGKFQTRVKLQQRLNQLQAQAAYNPL